MSRAGDLRVSDRGQMSLPAAARRRWGLVDGGSVGYIDIGDGGTADSRRRREAASGASGCRFRSGLGGGPGRIRGPGTGQRVTQLVDDRLLVTLLAGGDPPRPGGTGPHHQLLVRATVPGRPEFRRPRRRALNVVRRPAPDDAHPGAAERCWNCRRGSGWNPCEPWPR